MIFNLSPNMTLIFLIVFTIIFLILTYIIFKAKVTSSYKKDLYGRSLLYLTFDFSQVFKKKVQ
jgi:hypothetical protein